uniref:DNA-directed DNA polymerase n=1 Tax=Meloidogyne incognita TaxID=6306 RepID=A0A914KQQ5_MELIC
MIESDIPLSELSYDAYVYVPKVVEYWNKKYTQNGFIFKVFVFGDRCGDKPKYVYGPDNYNTPIPIYYSQDHFDGIRTVGAQFGQHWQYCYSCQKKYRKAKEHTSTCKSLCLLCGRVGIGRPCPIVNDFNKECKDCGKIFRNNDCFEHHKSSNHCLQSKQCEKCGVIWRIKDINRDPAKKHICGHKWCIKCIQYHSSERGCFIKPLKPKKKTPYRLVTFDFESTQHTKHPQNQNHRLHHVNFIAATIICTNCMENDQWKASLKQLGKLCHICGKYRNITFSHRTFQQSHVDEQRVIEDPLHDFVNWILFELDNKFTTIAFSHFGGRYDMVMTFREIFLKGIVPSIIRRGNKLYELRVSKTQNSCEVIFRDSYNICPVALGQLVGAFDLQVHEKQFFPHLANNPCNYDITLQRLPPKSDYLYGGMLPEKQKIFDQWYDQEKDKTFCLNEALAEYCLNDVQILTEALLAFRVKFLEISKPKNSNKLTSGIDILLDAMTIASACMKHFRLNHLKDEHLAIVPEKGYDRCDNQSEIAMKYLEWYAEVNRVEVRTAYSDGGEFTVAGRYKVDGYIEVEDRAIEVHGCVWHACPKHFGDRPDHVLPNGKTIEVVRREDNARLEILRKHIRQVDVVWECEIKEMLRRNGKMRKCFSNYIDKGPIKLRDCFFGGRTGPLSLHYEVDEEHEISYLDFNSLYPSTIATTSFPIGHPKIIIVPKNEQDVYWTASEHIPIKGILKIFLIPPYKTEIPVMPVKFDDRLLFPLCRQCSLDFPRGGIIPDYSCQHGDKERGWVSTCTSIELGEALNNGYKVIKYFRALHYEKWDNELFKGYVSEFMSMKIHSSGFPKEIDSHQKEEKFIRECQEKFGIYLEREKMIPDKAMRYISKLMLNSLWGRFSLRNTLTKSHITDSPTELRNFVENKSIEVNSIDKLTESTVLINYETKNEFIEEHQTSNIVISLWTTSMARINLFRAMQKISGTQGCSLLYGDTDSVLFSYPKNMGSPLTPGYHLGELSEEYGEFNIKEYVGAACKAYALKMIDKKTGEEKSMLKVRGITLTSDICKKLHYTSFKESVLDFGRISEENEFREISNNDNDDEGIVTRNMKIVDFGHK